MLSVNLHPTLKERGLSTLMFWFCHKSKAVVGLPSCLIEHFSSKMKLHNYLISRHTKICLFNYNNTNIAPNITSFLITAKINVALKKGKNRFTKC